MDDSGLREKVATVINNRYYVPPGVMAEMVDAIIALIDAEYRSLLDERDDLMLFYVAMLPKFQPTYYSREMLALTTRIEARRSHDRPTEKA